MLSFRDLQLEERATILAQAAELLVDWPVRRRHRVPAHADELAIVVFSANGATIQHRGDFAHALRRRGRYQLSLECVRRKVRDGEQLLFFEDDSGAGAFEVVNHERERAAMAGELEHMKATLAELEAQNGRG